MCFFFFFFPFTSAAVTWTECFWIRVTGINSKKQKNKKNSAARTWDLQKTLLPETCYKKSATSYFIKSLNSVTISIKIQNANVLDSKIVWTGMMVINTKESMKILPIIKLEVSNNLPFKMVHR